MSHTRILRTRLPATTHTVVEAIARQQQLTESAWLRRLVETTLQSSGVVLQASSNDGDLTHTLKEMQPRLQLTEDQYNHWSAKRQVLLVEFDSAHKVDVIHVASNRIPDPSDWIAFGELREITE